MRLSERFANGTSRRVLFFTVVLLSIEFLDELVFGAREAAWPLIRDDLRLSYVQVGLLLGVPGVIGNMIELPLGVLGDVWNRRKLIVGGGIVFALALLVRDPKSAIVHHSTEQIGHSDDNQHLFQHFSRGRARPLWLDCRRSRAGVDDVAADSAARKRAVGPVALLLGIRTAEA